VSYPGSRAVLLESGVAFVVLGAVIAVVLLVSGTVSRVSHPLWLDESITALLANDPRFTHAVRAIRSGVENNPPTYYLFLWPITHVLGGLGAVGLRVFAGVSMVLALIGLYATCRLYFERERAIVGTLAVAAHPLVVAQMFEIRFYGAWLAASTWLVFAILAPTGGAGHAGTGQPRRGRTGRDHDHGRTGRGPPGGPGAARVTSGRGHLRRHRGAGRRARQPG